MGKRYDPDFAVFSTCSVQAGTAEYTVEPADFLAKRGGTYEYAAADANGNQVIVAFHAHSSLDPETVARHDAVCCLMKNNSGYFRPLIGHGVANVFNGIHRSDVLFEVYPYEEQKSVEALDESTLLNEFLPQIAHALLLLHMAGFAHLHIRPECVAMMDDGAFVLDGCGLAEQIPLGDSSAFVDFDGSGNCFTAPEGAYGNACMASDAYTLALLVLTLLNDGKFPFTSSRVRGLRIMHDEIAQCVSDFRLPVDVNRKLKTLLIGCLQRTAANRYTMDDVVGFCDNQNWVAPPITERARGQSFVLWDDSVVHSLADLSDIVSDHWSKGLQFLKDGSLVATLRNNDRMSLASAIQLLPRGAEQLEASLYKALHVINPDAHIRFRGYNESLGEFIAAAKNDETRRKCLLYMLRHALVSWKLGKLAQIHPAATEALPLVERIEKEKWTELGMWKLIFSFQPPAKPADWAVVMDEFIQPDDQGAMAAARLVDEPAILAQLYCFGIDVDTLVMNAKGKSDDVKSTLVFKAFESQCPLHARKAFLHHGPFAGIVWLQKSISHYTFPEEGRQIRSLLSTRLLQEEMTIDSMFEAIMEFHLTLHEQFVEMLDSNLLGHVIGLRPDKQSIVPKSPQDYLTELHCGRPVSRAFIRNLRS